MFFTYGWLAAAFGCWRFFRLWIFQTAPLGGAGRRLGRAVGLTEQTLGVIFAAALASAFDNGLKDKT